MLAIPDVMELLENVLGSHAMDAPTRKALESLSDAIWSSTDLLSGLELRLRREDADGDGAVDAREFRRALVAAGCTMPLADTTLVFKHLDKDRNGLLRIASLSVALRAGDEQLESLKERALAAARTVDGATLWRALSDQDMEASGLIPLSRLRAIIQGIGLDLSPRDVGLLANPHALPVEEGREAIISYRSFLPAIGVTSPPAHSQPMLQQWMPGHAAAAGHPQLQPFMTHYYPGLPSYAAPGAWSSSPAPGAHPGRPTTDTAALASSAAMPATPSRSDMWDCPVCLYKNMATESKCWMCATRRSMNGSASLMASTGSQRPPPPFQLGSPTPRAAPAHPLLVSAIAPSHLAVVPTSPAAAQATAMLLSQPISHAAPARQRRKQRHSKRERSSSRHRRHRRRDSAARYIYAAYPSPWAGHPAAATPVHSGYSTATFPGFASQSHFSVPAPAGTMTLRR